MYLSNVQFSDVNSVQQVNNSQYQITLVADLPAPKYLGNQNIYSFSRMYNLL